MYETPERKPIVYFYVVMAPLYKTQSPIRNWSPILTSGKQIKRLIFEVLIMEAMGSWCHENNGKNLEACMWVLWTWISGWVHWWFWLGLWSRFCLCLIYICDLGLCLCLVSVSFLYFFHLCCCDLGLSFWLLDLCFWLLDLIWEEHEEQVVMFLWKIIMISNNVLLLGFYSFAWAWVWFGSDLLEKKRKKNDWNNFFYFN